MVFLILWTIYVPIFFLRKPSKLGSLSKNICMCTVCVSVCCVCLFKILSLLQWFMLKYFNSEPSFKLRWCCARDLFGSQIPVTTEGLNYKSLAYEVVT